MFHANAEFYINGAIACGAVVFAAFTQFEERREAILLAALSLFVWGLNCASYASWAPQHLLTLFYQEKGYGSDVILPGGNSVDLWAFYTLVQFTAVSVLAPKRWWGIVLMPILITELIFHTFYWSRAIGWEDYQVALQQLFWAEEALFFVIGGGALKDACGRAWSRFLGDFPGSLRPARQQALAQSRR